MGGEKFCGLLLPLLFSGVIVVGVGGCPKTPAAVILLLSTGGVGGGKLALVGVGGLSKSDEAVCVAVVAAGIPAGGAAGVAVGSSFMSISCISSSSDSTSSSMEANCSMGAAGTGGGANCCAVVGGAAACGGGGAKDAGPLLVNGRAALKSIDAADVTMLTVMPRPPSSLPSLS